jgi:signal transduction histidine kinase
VQGRAQISGPLFKSDQGWHKTLYYKMRQGGAWLRIEAGTPLLGAVADLQKRLIRLALALLLPSLLIGLGLAYALTRRAGQLRAKLLGARGGLDLGGKDEFSAIAITVDGLLKSLGQEREQNEKLLQARISQARHLAFGVAHELRNPLAGLSLTVELLDRKAAEGAPASELKPLSGRIQAEAARMEHTVARFLDFARTPVIKPQACDLASLALASAKGLLPAPVISGQGRALADEKAASLILGILLSNACEAAGGQGEVRLQLEGAFVRVWDSGVQVPEQDRERLFTPFFTTKPKGMGLGLATASSLADAMGGRLSLLQDGKTFQLELPCPPGAGTGTRP